MDELNRVIIIIPTYNEENTIETTLQDLESVFKTVTSYHLSILVFDSSSTDGTQQKVAQMQSQYNNISLFIEPEKSGLGSAYVKAIKFAMSELNPAIIFQFDADGSHQPKHIPEMLKLLQNGADVVIGSRYIPGGSIPDNWAFYRKCISRMGNQIARLFLTRKYHDYTTGFRGIKTETLRKVNLDHLLSKNYAHLLNLLWAFHKTGAKIVESPIEFIDREQGYSKFPANNVIESLKVVILLRLLEYKRYFKVAIVGASGALLQLIIFNILRNFSSPEIANLLAIECAILSNFILNNHFSFSEKKFQRKFGFKFLVKKFLNFNLLVSGSLILQVVIVTLGNYFFGRGFLIENTMVISGILLASIINYYAYSRLIWR